MSGAPLWLGLAGAVLGVLGSGDAAVWGLAGVVAGQALALAQLRRDVGRRLARLEQPAADARTATPREAARAPAPSTPPAAATSVLRAPTLPTSRTAASPDPVATALNHLRDLVFGGNTLARVGVVLLLFGIGFVAKYAADNDYLPIELRLAAAALLGLGLIAFGLVLRLRRPAYATTLQGGGIGILFVVVTAALRLYALFPASFAFAVFVVLAVCAGVLAVMQDALALAFLGSLGGFLAPILASTGGGSHIALFGYYAVLNAGIVGVAYAKSWRPLNLLGFVFTFGVGIAWGVLRYEPAHLWSSEFFLVLFFVMFVSLGLLFAWRRPGHAAVDGTLVFGTPLIAFGLQASLLRDHELGLALSAVGLGALYAGLAAFTLRRAPTRLRFVTEAYLALGVAFATLALPLGLNARWTSAGWALEGAALVWVGVRQQRVLSRVAGYTLCFAAGIALVLHGLVPGTGWPVVNTLHLGALLIGVSAYGISFLLERSNVADRDARFMALAWGAAWVVVPTLLEIQARRPDDTAAMMLSVLAALAFLHELLGTRLRFAALRHLALGMLGFLVFFGLAWMVQEPHPAARGGAWAWPLAWVAWALIVWRQRSIALSRALIVPSLWLVAALTSWQLAYGLAQLAQGGSAWWHAGLLVGVSASLWVALAPRAPWPWRSLTAFGRELTAFGLGTALWLVSLGLCMVASGDARPLPHVPLVNPLDLAQVASLVTLWAWARQSPQARPLHYANGALALAWLSAAAARSVHHLEGLPFDWSYLLPSVTLQTTWAIVWTLVGAALLVLATRRAARELWVVGAVLLAAVVLKLFTVDLSSAGTLARIISFVGVGLLLLIIGFVAPVPPRRASA